jgi:predicted regulator of Ras-like GTPase activity (Roadblock/LC7/MglB family)
MEDPGALGAELAEVFKQLETSDRGTLNLFSLEATQGHLFMSNINEVTFLIVQTGEPINLGRVRYDVRSAALRLKDEL